MQSSDMKNAHEKMRQIMENTFKIKVEVLEGGKLPSKKNPTDAGWDLFATEDITIYPGQVMKHPVNIRMQLPAGTWGEITSKSGLGAQGLLVYAGVIDEEYRGIPHVVMTNVKHKKMINSIVEYRGDNETVYEIKLVDNTEPIVIKKGEKLAQFIMNPYSSNYFIEQVDKIDTETSRGEGGFGSTGKT